jgi:hypothetical protein
MVILIPFFARARIGVMMNNLKDIELYSVCFGIKYNGDKNKILRSLYE